MNCIQKLLIITSELVQQLRGVRLRRKMVYRTCIGCGDRLCCEFLDIAKFQVRYVECRNCGAANRMAEWTPKKSSKKPAKLAEKFDAKPDEKLTEIAVDIKKALFLATSMSQLC